MYEESFKKLVKEGAEYLIGSCEPLFIVSAVMDEQLRVLCAAKLCEGNTEPVKFEHRLYALKERFEEAVADEMERLEYFNCDTCGWWCWGEERSSSREGQVCQDCYEEQEDE